MVQAEYKKDAKLLLKTIFGEYKKTKTIRLGKIRKLNTVIKINTTDLSYTQLHQSISLFREIGCPIHMHKPNTVTIVIKNTELAKIAAYYKLTKD